MAQHTVSEKLLLFLFSTSEFTGTYCVNNLSYGSFCTSYVQTLYFIHLPRTYLAPYVQIKTLFAKALWQPGKHIIFILEVHGFVSYFS